jgi:hypothetical protein
MTRASSCKTGVLRFDFFSAHQTRVAKRWLFQLVLVHEFSYSTVSLSTSSLLNAPYSLVDFNDTGKRTSNERKESSIQDAIPHVARSELPVFKQYNAEEEY